MSNDLPKIFLAELLLTAVTLLFFLGLLRSCCVVACCGCWLAGVIYDIGEIRKNSAAALGLLMSEKVEPSMPRNVVKMDSV